MTRRRLIERKPRSGNGSSTSRRACARGAALIIGDLNTDASPSTLPGAKYLDELFATGWTDLNTERTHRKMCSWWNRRGDTITRYVIDHAYASPMVHGNARLVSAIEGQLLMRDPASRRAGLSDHALLIVDI